MDGRRTTSNSNYPRDISATPCAQKTCIRIARAAQQGTQRRIARALDPEEISIVITVHLLVIVHYPLQQEKFENLTAEVRRNRDGQTFDCLSIMKSTILSETAQAAERLLF